MASKSLLAPRAAYRVGMSREASRYIEPDAIYPEMSRGAAMRIPAQFPFTWTPVNGLGGPFEDLLKIGQNILNDTTQVGKDRAKQAVLDSLNNTPAGRAFLDAVQDKATVGVTNTVKKAAPNLILLAVAAGAVGGVLSDKLGKTGTVLAILAGGFAAFKLLTIEPPKE